MGIFLQKSFKFYKFLTEKALGMRYKELIYWVVFFLFFFFLNKNGLEREMWNYHHTLKLFENRTIMLELLSIQPSQNGCLPLILKLLFASHLILWLTQLAKGQNLDFPVPSLLSINYHSLKIEHLHIKLKWFGFELNYAQVKKRRSWF